MHIIVYNVLKIIGEGGYGVVYKCIDKKKVVEILQTWTNFPWLLENPPRKSKVNMDKFFISAR